VKRLSLQAVNGPRSCSATTFPAAGEGAAVVALVQVDGSATSPSPVIRVFKWLKGIHRAGPAAGAFEILVPLSGKNALAGYETFAPVSTGVPAMQGEIPGRRTSFSRGPGWSSVSNQDMESRHVQ
jgi:hypothetical protein